MSTLPRSVSGSPSLVSKSRRVVASPVLFGRGLAVMALFLVLVNLVACGGGSSGTGPEVGSGPSGGNGSLSIAGTRWRLVKMNGMDLPVKIGELDGKPDMVIQGELAVKNGQDFDLIVNASITFSFAASYGVYTVRDNQINFSAPFWQDSFKGELRGRMLVIRYDQSKSDDTSNSDWDTEFTFELEQGSIGTGPAVEGTDPNAVSIVNRWLLRAIESIALPVKITAQDGSGLEIVIVEGRLYAWDAQAWLLTFTLGDFKPPYTDYGLYTVRGNVVTFSPSVPGPRFTGELRDGTLVIQYDLAKHGMRAPPLAFALEPGG